MPDLTSWELHYFLHQLNTSTTGEELGEIEHEPREELGVIEHKQG